ncbi:MAG: N-acetylmuramoyl-L-alanine amidase [Armatimonadetes bacterium]|nr:N-acetylmuramoyl-L-alanine amidase [Armatimonadota bacterium]
MVGLFLVLTLQAPAIQPSIITREEWGAKPVGAGAKEHVIKRLTIHHAGVMSNAKRSLEDKLRGLQAFGQREDKLADGRTKPAWPDIPYHYYIAIDGRIGEGRPWQYVGDTNTTYDPTGHLLIMVEGDFTKEKPTREELESLRKLTLWAVQKWNLNPDEIMGHGDFAETDCPGTYLKNYLSRLRYWVKGEQLKQPKG